MSHLRRIYWSVLTITADQLQKNSLWYLDTDRTTANTNTRFEARHTLTKAARDDALNAGEKDVNVIIPLNLYSFFLKN